MNRTHYAIRRGSKTMHVITNVHWPEGQEALYLTTECGVKLAEVQRETVDRANLSKRVCKRCLHTLGWDR